MFYQFPKWYRDQLATNRGRAPVPPAPWKILVVVGSTQDRIDLISNITSDRYRKLDPQERRRRFGLKGTLRAHLVPIPLTRIQLLSLPGFDAVSPAEHDDGISERVTSFELLSDIASALEICHRGGHKFYGVIYAGSVTKEVPFMFFGDLLVKKSSLFLELFGSANLSSFTFVNTDPPDLEKPPDHLAYSLPLTKYSAQEIFCYQPAGPGSNGRSGMGDIASGKLSKLLEERHQQLQQPYGILSSLVEKGMHFVPYNTFLTLDEVVRRMVRVEHTKIMPKLALELIVERKMLFKTSAYHATRELYPELQDGLDTKQPGPAKTETQNEKYGLCHKCSCACQGEPVSVNEKKTSTASDKELGQELKSEVKEEQQAEQEEKKWEPPAEHWGV
ncbi:hypothetical protein ABW21_db0202009 [Orbilia brochopaga]|nr:hypothetical protein ABW21_db0202009 [Drechslerella brochopaga]